MIEHKRDASDLALLAAMDIHRGSPLMAAGTLISCPESEWFGRADIMAVTREVADKHARIMAETDASEAE